MKTLFSLKNVHVSTYRIFSLVVMILLFPTGGLWAQSGNIGGFVFNDYNFNGVQEEFEYGVEGVMVKAYGSNDLIYETETQADGSYLISNLLFSNIAYRVEFHMPENLSSYNYTISGANANSNVRFVGTPTESLDLGISLPEEYCESIPKVGVSCFIDGSYLEATVNDYGYAIFDYDSYGIPGDVGHKAPDHVASVREIGAVYGSAYCPSQNIVYTSAVMKRHTSLGELGAGGIYKIDLNHLAYPGKAQPFITIEGKAKPNGSLVRMGGDFERDLSVPGFPTKDSLAYAAAVKSSIGDLEISWDGTKMYIVNLYESEVIVYDVATDRITKVYSFNEYSCSNGALRPFGLKLRGNSLFVGAICTAENQEGTAEDLTAVVFEINETDTPQKILEFPMNYDRNGNKDFNWHPWRDEYIELKPFGYREQIYPQPIVGDIEFLEDGSMVLGIVDRYGFQTGYTNMKMNGRVEERGIPMGDMIKVCRVDGQWIVEGNSEGCLVNIDSAPNDNGGPGGTEFFDDESVIHDELSQGSLAILPGSGQMVTTTIDPLRFDAFGVSFMNNVTGKNDRKYEVGYAISTFIKGQSLGDVEVFCGLAPLEIGNYVWMDENSDGIQDADEQPISNCEVCLHDQNGNILGCTLTDEKGQYSIGDDDIGDSTLMYGRQYFVSVGISGQFDPQSGLFEDQLELTSPGVGMGLNNSYNDSDGFIAPESVGRGVLEGLPVAEVYLNKPGDIEHGCDFGFKPMSAKIGDYVWLDENKNGTKDSLEIGLPNLKITLLDNDQIPLETTYTNEYGHYQFEIAQPNFYHLQLDTNTNYMFAIMEHNTLDQDYRFSTQQRGLTVAIDVEEEEHDLLWDFAVRKITIDTVVFSIEDTSMVLCIPDSVIDHQGNGNSQILSCQNDSIVPVRISGLEDDCFEYNTVHEFFQPETLCHVSCARGICDTTVLVLVGKHPPLANDDYITLERLDEAVAIDVLQNDVDFDGDDLSIVEIMALPLRGNAYINDATETIEYEPFSSFSEMDSFVYEICDADIEGNIPKDGCDQATVYINYENPNEVTCYVPKGISPNGDGKNDYFEIECLESLNVSARLQVYNRWGQMVYANESYNNDWNGTYDGKNLASGTYFFSLTVLGESEALASQAGSLEIRR